MGFGAFNAVIYGCLDIRAGNDHVAEGTWDKFFAEVAEACSVRRPYNYGERFFGTYLLDTLGHDESIGPNTILDQLGREIYERLPVKDKLIAEAAWTSVQAIGRKTGINVPDGNYLWVNDYD